MPRLVVQLSSTAANDPKTGGTRSAAQAVAHAVRTAGGSVTPMHPGTTDATLARYLSVDLPSEESAATLAAELSRLPSVEAAYVKPDDAPPGG